MLLFVDEQPDNEEVLLAGLRPLPVNRMLKQAGRKVTKDRIDNQSFMGGRNGSPMTPGLRQEGMDRLKRTQDAINDWDPIEASAKEDFNRMRGGRRGPIIGPGAADELIQTIETPIAPATSLGDLKYGI